jgi:hypothetical protein
MCHQGNPKAQHGELSAQFEAVENHLGLDDSRCPRSEEGLLARNRTAWYYP